MGSKVMDNSLAEDMAMLLKTSLLTDIVLVINSDIIIPAHSQVLAARSPVFNRMLQNGMKESSSKEIHITDTTEELFREFLNYLYTGRYNDRQEELTPDFLLLADKYDVRGLKLECERKLSNHLTVENVMQKLWLADTYNSPFLKQYALDYIVSNFMCVFKTPSFGEVCTRCPHLFADIHKYFLENDSLKHTPAKKQRY